MVSGGKGVMQSGGKQQLFLLEIRQAPQEKL